MSQITATTDLASVITHICRQRENKILCVNCVPKRDAITVPAVLSPITMAAAGQAASHEMSVLRPESKRQYQVVP
jgi:hypothetical protein